MKTTPVEFTADADAEARAAYAWYGERNPSAAERFWQELERAVEDVAEAPLRWPIIEPNVRRRNFRRFPYALLYACREDAVTVLAVMHQHRRPGYWR